MPAPTADLDRPPRETWPIIAAAVIGGAYALGHLSWYLGTPLGQVPVLDEREGLAFANALLSGHIPAEPFYRAPGYAVFLAMLHLVGVPPTSLFGAALVAGAAFHAINAALVAWVAREWFGRNGAIAAGLLFALNPVFIHFAVQAGDATPAITFFLAGLAAMAGAKGGRAELSAAGSTTAETRPARWAVASLCWAIATALRPNYFLVWLVLPALAVWRTVRGGMRKHFDADSGEQARRGMRKHFDAFPTTAPRLADSTKALRLLAACAGIVVFLALGTWQYHVSGQFGFLPAQGAYNLWAANQPDANGRYYTQKLALPAAVAEQNPARAESILLFENETGQTAITLDTVNAYWRGRFIHHVTHHPVAWIEQLGRKLYALLNDWEQYNNETPAFHIARSPWLRWNPIGWGILFVLAIAGTARLAHDQPAVTPLLGWAAVACAASALLFFVSARFRLPLAAIATILAGGALAPPWSGRSWSRSRQIALGAGSLVAAVLAFSNFDDVRDRSTFVQDHVLLARAADAVGDDTLAWNEAQAALAMRPDHPDALRLAVASYFNLLLTNSAPPVDERRWHADATALLQSATPDAPDLRAVAALAQWRAGELDAAVAEWRKLDGTPSAVAARLLVHDESVGRANVAAVFAEGPRQPLVQIARAALELNPGSSGASADAAQLRATAVRLFRTTPLRADATRPPS